MAHNNNIYYTKLNGNNEMLLLHGDEETAQRDAAASCLEEPHPILEITLLFSKGSKSVY